MSLIIKILYRTQIIFRTKSDTPIKVETVDNEMDSEIKNESVLCTEKECNGIYFEPVTETINTQVNEQQMNLGSKEILKKSNKKYKTRGERDQIFKRIRKGGDKRLTTLKERKKPNNNHTIPTFFKCMASTVVTFPPHLIAESKIRVANLIFEMKLRSLTGQTYTPSMT